MIRIIKRRIRYLIRRIYYRVRLSVFKTLWGDFIKLNGSPIICQPTVFNGLGEIIFGKNVTFGFYPSPHFYSGSCYIEARYENSKIIIGDNVVFNNNLTMIAEKTSITIGNQVLVGWNVEITDSDFHNLTPLNRHSGDHKCLPIIINDNVFIGSNVVILKGVEIGKNSVIANSAVVTENIPSDCIAAGIPAKVIKKIGE